MDSDISDSLTVPVVNTWHFVGNNLSQGRSSCTHPFVIYYIFKSPDELWPVNL